MEAGRGVRPKFSSVPGKERGKEGKVNGRVLMVALSKFSKAFGENAPPPRNRPALAALPCSVQLGAARGKSDLVIL